MRQIGSRSAFTRRTCAVLTVAALVTGAGITGYSQGARQRVQESASRAAVLPTAPAGASRPARTRLWFDIRSAGAAGNGIADDTRAVQVALADASRAGRPVFCSPGTYLISAPVTVGVDLIGTPSVGQAACTIKYTGAGAALSVTASPVTIRNLVLNLAGDAHPGAGGILVQSRCEHCVFSSIVVLGRPNKRTAYLDYGIRLPRGGDEDRFTNVSTLYATSAIVAGSGTNHVYQSTFMNVFAHNCGQAPDRACLQIDGAVDTVMNSGLGGGDATGAPTRNAVLVSGSDAEAIDVIATELLADAPGGTAVVLRRPPGDASVATLIDVRLPVASTLVSDVVTPPRLTQIATQESGQGPVGFVKAAAPAATFEPLAEADVTLDRCACTAVAGTITFHTGRAAASDDPVRGPFATLAFNRAYPSAPVVLLSPGSASAIAAGIYADSTDRTGVRLAAAALRPGTRYVVSYQVVER